MFTNLTNNELWKILIEVLHILFSPRWYLQKRNSGRVRSFNERRGTKSIV